MSDADDTQSLVTTRPARSGENVARIPILVVLAGRHVIGHVFRVNDAKTIVGRSFDSDVWLDEPSISRHHAHVDASNAGFKLVDLESKNGTFVNGEPVREHVLKDGDRIQVGLQTIVMFTYQEGIDDEFQRRLYESATRDPVTGLYNRKFFVEALHKEFAHARRHGSELALMMLACDQVRQLNTAGEASTADAVLQHIARVLSARFRAEDALARYGGEQFVVLLRESSRDNAAGVAQRVQALVHSSPFVVAQKSIKLTASIGVADLKEPGLATPEALLALADRRMTAAKAARSSAVGAG